MTEKTEKPISEKQALIRLSIFVAVIFTVTLLVTKSFLRHSTTTKVTPGSTSTAKINLQVLPPNSSSQTQQAVTPFRYMTNGNVQSSRSDLQPADNSAQLPGSLKQELGI